MASIHEIKKWQKILWHCPFKCTYFFFQFVYKLSKCDYILQELSLFCGDGAGAGAGTGPGAFSPAPAPAEKSGSGRLQLHNNDEDDEDNKGDKVDEEDKDKEDDKDPIGGSIHFLSKQ